MQNRFGKRLITGTLCVGLTASMFVTTAMAAPYDDVTIAGVAAAVQQEEEEQRSALVAPLASAAVLSNAALAVQAAAAETPEAVEEEHPSIAAAEARKEAEANSPYHDIAISQVENYVNIRTNPNTEAEVVGKIYNNSAADILETVEQEDGTWYRIQSGSVEGYIKAEYFVTGTEAEAIAKEVGYVTATINTETLRLRANADLSSDTLTLLSQGESYEVCGENGDFTELMVDNDLYGYVANDYIDVKVEFAEAVSLEEERAEQERQAQLERERQEAEERAAREAAEREAQQEAEEEEDEPEREYREPETRATEPETRATEPETRATEPETEATEPETAATEPETEATEPETEATEPETEATEPETEATEPETEEEKEESSSSGSVSSLRYDLASYAESFAGNLPYVWGGTSLTKGADCSGFVQSIFKTYGISLPRTSDEQGYTGKSISYSEIRPGDIVYYGGHIAIYIGDGQVVHASSTKTGVKISTWNYRTPISIRNVIGD